MCALLFTLRNMLSCFFVYALYLRNGPVQIMQMPAHILDTIQIRKQQILSREKKEKKLMKNSRSLAK